MARPVTPNHYIINLDDLIDKLMPDLEAYKESHWVGKKLDVDIVIPVWETLSQKVAKYAVFLLGRKMYISKKSSFVEFIKAERNNINFYIYDKFKGGSHSHKNSYSNGTFEVVYPEEGVDSIYVTYYWRID